MKQPFPSSAMAVALLLSAASLALAQPPVDGAIRAPAPAAADSNASRRTAAGANAFGLSSRRAPESNADGRSASGSSVGTAIAAGVASGGGNTSIPPARGPSLDLALEAAQTAVQTCRGLDQRIGVTVVDSAGVLKVFLATDGASTRGIASSTNKALTSLAFGASTSELGEKIKTDSSLAEKVSANPNYNTRAGGLLLEVGAEVIGAIGVGGAKGSEKDESCARAGVEKIQNRLK